MNKQQMKTLSQSVALAVALVALAPFGAQAQAQAPADPIQIARRYQDAVNSADFNKASAIFADDAVVKHPAGVLVGKAEIDKWLKLFANAHRFALKTVEMQGPLVTSTGAFASELLAEAGVPYVAYRTEYVVTPEGKIRFFGLATLPTPEQLAKIRASAPPAVKPTVDPLKVAQDYVKAANAGNFNAANALFAPNAAALLKGDTRLLSGKDQISEWLKADIGTTRSTPAGWQVVGSTVVNTGTISIERFKWLDIDPIQYRTEYVVEDGKIRFLRPTLSLTPEQQAKMGAARATVAPFTGTWVGQVAFSDAPNDPQTIQLSVLDACIVGGVCGQTKNLNNGCIWQLRLLGVQDATLRYTFSKTLAGNCPSGSDGSLQLTPDGKLHRKHIAQGLTIEGTLVKK